MNQLDKKAQTDRKTQRVLQRIAERLEDINQKLDHLIELQKEGYFGCRCAR